LARKEPKKKQKKNKLHVNTTDCINLDVIWCI